MTNAQFEASVLAEIRRMIRLGEQDAERDYPIVTPFNIAELVPAFMRDPQFLCVCPTCGGTGDNCYLCHGRGYLTKSEGWKR